MKKIAILIVILLVLLPLFKTGLFDVHDPTSVIRFYALHESLKFGQFPAAWTNLLNQGFGYPLFLYYAPVFSYLGVILKLFVPTYILSLKLSLGVMVILAALGMYKLMSKYAGELGALVATIAYTLLPYHAATLYVRGSYSEGMVWALLPWLLYLWSKDVRDKYWIVLTSVVTALFFLSHNSLPFVFIPFLIIWILLHPGKSWRPIILAATFSMGLSMWFLLPVFFERNLVQIDRIAEATVYSDHFLSPGQLWHSAWGYGGSARIGEVDGMSFMLGKFQLMITALSLVVIALVKKWNRQILYFLGVIIFYTLMTTSYSAGIWSLVPNLSILQFPWRLIAFASFGISCLTAYFVHFLPRKLQLLTSLVLMFGLIFFNLKFFAPQTQIGYLDQDLLSQEKLATVAKDKIPEYLPASMPSFPTTISADGLVHSPVSVSGSLINQEAIPLTLSTAYMPQWQLTINGTKVGIVPNEAGLITTVIPVQAGQNNLSLTWHRTQVENLGLGLSALTILLMIGLLVI